MPLKHVDTLILDLDNTLFDWFAVWYASFHPLYEEILKAVELPASEVEAEIRKVHQVQRTSEYTFLLEELPCLAKIRADSDVRARFREALDKSRQGRDQTLKLYPTVFRSLWTIKEAGTKIVAYTESMEFYSAYRLKRFGLDGVIDVLFSPTDHELPHGVSIEQMRHLPDEYYQLEVTQVKHTPEGELKPNPKVLLEIIRAIDADASRCAYVGDSLFKDVAMARDAGVLDVHAKYGESQRRPEYELLQRISHWTEKDVQREKEISKKGGGVAPSAVLANTFSELFTLCRFAQFTPAGDDTSNTEETSEAIELWKKAVDVQQHFNDLEMRTRNSAITVVGALLAAVGFTYQQGLQIVVLGYVMSAGVGFVFAALFAWIAFFLMDRYWYHVFLKAAGEHAGAIEERYAGKLPGISLATSISKASGEVTIGWCKVNSSTRLNLFYGLGTAMLMVVFLSLFFAQPHPVDKGVPAKTVLINLGMAKP